jgi:ribosomal protein S18 acetylase RimI-like enzyme
MKCTLRPAVPSDRAWLWRTKRTCMRSYVEQTWGIWDEASQRAHFDTGFVLSEIRVIVGDGVDAGYISAAVEDGQLRLFNIMIDPAFQNRGLGTAVLGWLQGEARALGLPLRLQVLRVNPARALYERLGFRVVEETLTHFRMQWIPGASPRVSHDQSDT